MPFFFYLNDISKDSSAMAGSRKHISTDIGKHTNMIKNSKNSNKRCFYGIFSILPIFYENHMNTSTSQLHSYDSETMNFDFNTVTENWVKL